MVIREINIENYTCYYGKNTFSLSPKLNIILGENGEGKTMFYEALDWLFRNETVDPQMIVSRKAENEMNDGDQLTVMVEIIVDQFNEEVTVSKYFHVEKSNETFQFTKPSLRGYVLNKSTGEREPQDGQILLDRIFSSNIRRFSMFKGEKQLNIFENDDALFDLVKTFSVAKHYKDYSVVGEYLSEQSQKAVDKAAANNRKNEKALEILNAKLEILKRKRADKKTLMSKSETEKDKLANRIKEANKYVENAEALEIHNKRIEGYEKKISDYRAGIDENYTTRLFDDLWILSKYEELKNGFAKKIQDWDFSKRKLQSEYDQKIGEEKAKLNLVKGRIPLPVTTPSKEHMEEMIDELVCKVCNREFKEGDETYLFMKKRLQEYLKFIGEIETSKEEVEKELFKKNYISSLKSLNTILRNEFNKPLKNIINEIKEDFKFNHELQNKILSVQGDLEKEKEERSKLIGLSSLGAEKLGTVLKDYNHWITQKARESDNISSYKNEIADIQEAIRETEKEKNKITDKSVGGFLLETRDILKDLETVFKETEETKLTEFINSLENKANNILSTINIDAFTGKIQFELISDLDTPKIRINLVELNGRDFQPNQSLETSMYMSILLAIAEITNEVNDEDYPLVFDAPTSSFGETKTTEFLNLISKTNNQIIILLKDYLNKDVKNNLRVKDEFFDVKFDKAFWVRLKRPFDPKKLHTLNTNVIDL